MPVRSGYMPVKKALRPEVQLCMATFHENCTLVADAIDVRRFPDRPSAVVDARLHPTDVVPHDKHDVGLLLLRLRGGRCRRWRRSLRPARQHRRSDKNQRGASYAE